MDLQRFKAACARIAANGEIGTGYLIASDVVATCDHVVKNVPEGSTLFLTFHGDTKARTGAVLARDPLRDCALVRIAPPVTTIAPLPLAEECSEGDLWQSFGYPIVVGSDGDTFAGTIRDRAGLKSGQPMIELLCSDALAGRSPKISGLSGAPVLVSDRVVGHVSDVRADALKPGETVWGRLYAVGAGHVMKLPGFPGEAGRAPAPGPPAPPTATPGASRTDADRRFDAFREASRTPEGAALLSAQVFLDVGLPEAALTRLADAGEGKRATQLRALALARSGKKQEAVALLEPLFDAGDVDSETGGILGGRYKQLWLEGGNASLLARSFRVYFDTWRATQDVYPGVNALAMALWLRREAPSLLTSSDARALAREREEIARRCHQIREDERDGWRLATRAEVHLLEVEHDRAALETARRFYALAASRFGEKYQNVAVARKQARRTLQYLGLPDGEVDLLLPVPGVVACTGHMTDAPGRPEPRFPPQKVRGVRQAIRTYLEEHRVGFGFSSAARGSDLVFAEEILDRGGRMHVLLPFPAADFKGTSVGFGWNAAFDDVLSHAGTTVTVRSAQRPPSAEEPEAYARCNRAVRQAARRRAELMDQSPRLLAVWNGRAGDGPGGSADAVAEWRSGGLPEPRIIDPGALPLLA